MCLVTSGRWGWRIYEKYGTVVSGQGVLARILGWDGRGMRERDGSLGGICILCIVQQRAGFSFELLKGRESAVMILQCLRTWMASFHASVTGYPPPPQVPPLVLAQVQLQAPAQPSSSL